MWQRHPKNYISKNTLSRLLVFKRLNFIKPTRWFLLKNPAETLPLEVSPSLLHIAQSTTLVKFFKRRHVRVYNGRYWRKLLVSRWLLNRRSSSTTNPLVLAVFRKKTLTKKDKQPSLKKKLTDEIKILDIRKEKTGQKRKLFLVFADEVRRQNELITE